MEFVIVLAMWKGLQTAIVHAYPNLVIVAYIVMHAMNCVHWYCTPSYTTENNTKGKIPQNQ